MGSDPKGKKPTLRSVGEFSEFMGSSVIQICGRKEVTIDGCKGIVEYLDCEMKVGTNDGYVTVFGTDLNIKYLSINTVVVEGKLQRIEFSDPG